MNGFSSASVWWPFAPEIFTATATVHVRDISRQIVPRPGAIFSLGYISHLRMLAQLAGTSKRLMVSHPVLNSHGHYTRTLEKTSRPFPACCAIVTAERVWPRETTRQQVGRWTTDLTHQAPSGRKYFTHLSIHGLRTYTCTFRYTEWSWTSFKAPLSPFEVRRQLASCPAGLWWALVGLPLLPWRAWRAGAHSRSTQEERGTREMQLRCGWVQEWVSQHIVREGGAL